MDHVSGVGTAPPDGYRPCEEVQETWSLPRIVLAVSSVAATFFSALVFIETGSLILLGFTAAAALAAGLTFFWHGGNSQPIHRVLYTAPDTLFPLPSFWPVSPVRPQQPRYPLGPSNHVLVGDQGIVRRSMPFAPSAPPVSVLSGSDRVPVGNHRPVGIPVAIPLLPSRLQPDDRVGVGDHRTVR